MIGGDRIRKSSNNSDRIQDGYIPAECEIQLCCRFAEQRHFAHLLSVPLAAHLLDGEAATAEVEVLLD